MTRGDAVRLPSGYPSRSRESEELKESVIWLKKTQSWAIDVSISPAPALPAPPRDHAIAGSHDRTIARGGSFVRLRPRGGNPVHPRPRSGNPVHFSGQNPHKPATSPRKPHNIATSPQETRHQNREVATLCNRNREVAVLCTHAREVATPCTFRAKIHTNLPPRHENRTRLPPRPLEEARRTRKKHAPGKKHAANSFPPRRYSVSRRSGSGAVSPRTASWNASRQARMAGWLARPVRFDV